MLELCYTCDHKYVCYISNKIQEFSGIIELSNCAYHNKKDNTSISPVRDKRKEQEELNKKQEKVLIDTCPNCGNKIYNTDNDIISTCDICGKTICSVCGSYETFLENNILNQEIENKNIICSTKTKFICEDCSEL